MPMAIPRYIELITDKPLDTPAIWYRIVQRHTPSGVLLGLPTKKHGQPTVVQLVHRTCEDGHHYLVPLSRDLGASEVETIVTACTKALPSVDFDVATSETKLVAQDFGELPLDVAQHTALCLALSKRQHEDWVRERTDAGWRYGTRFSAVEKTHPLIRPWDQLPDRFRRPNFALPQTLIDLMADHGYTVLPRDELADLLKADRT